MGSESAFTQFLWVTQQTGFVGGLLKTINQHMRGL